MKINTSMILVANKGKAALFKWNARKKESKLIKKFTNKKIQKKESQLFTDRAGRGSTSYTHDQATMGESHYKEKLVDSFSIDIVNDVEEEMRKENLSSLTIISEPSLLGKIREKMSGRLRQFTKNEIAKNFYTENFHQLKTFLNKLPATSK
ncbi:MAG: host attachment protein [Bacteriovoracaceae bacterium]|jgi:protein required for attachment to host cells|nr:hypothetical protein [Halobacteriovoraceae bacterium]MDP7321134.1 host attachment protein [Bacteriovoracaceae bacterium]